MKTALEFARELMAPDADAVKIEARDREIRAAALMELANKLWRRAEEIDEGSHDEIEAAGLETAAMEAENMAKGRPSVMGEIGGGE